MNNIYNSPENAGKIKELKLEIDRLRTQYQVPND